MKSTKPQPHSMAARGAAMVMAVATLGVVAAIVATMTTLAWHSVGASGREAVASQVDQLHLAAVVMAADQLSKGETADRALDLPAPATGRIAWRPVGGAQRDCTVTITLAATTAERRLTFAQREGRWIMTRCEIE